MNIEITDLDMILNYLETTSLEPHDDYSSEFTYKDQKILYKYIKQLQQENKQLKDNWDKLKEYANKMHEYFLYTDVNEIYKQSMKPDNQFPNLFNLSELNASDRVLNSICKKIQELEQGNDNK